VRVLASNVNNTNIYQIHLLQPPSHEIPIHPKTHHIKAYFANLTKVDPYFPMTTFLSKVFIFILPPTNHLPPSPVQSQSLVKRRLKASEAFHHASKNIPHTSVAILSNQDIYFDDSLHLLLTPSPFLDLSPYTAYFLSRYEEPAFENASLIGVSSYTQLQINSQCFSRSHNAVRVLLGVMTHSCLSPHSLHV
jgi:hypothetical protein